MAGVAAVDDTGSGAVFPNDNPKGDRFDAFTLLLFVVAAAAAVGDEVESNGLGVAAFVAVTATAVEDTTGDATEMGLTVRVVSNALPNENAEDGGPSALLVSLLMIDAESDFSAIGFAIGDGRIPIFGVSALVCARLKEDENPAVNALAGDGDPKIPTGFATSADFDAGVD